MGSGPDRQEGCSQRVEFHLSSTKNHRTGRQGWVVATLNHFGDGGSEQIFLVRTLAAQSPRLAR
jgi:hypothetical protein